MSAEWITHLGTAQVLINDCIADPSSELALQTLLTGIASVLFFFFSYRSHHPKCLVWQVCDGQQQEA